MQRSSGCAHLFDIHVYIYIKLSVEDRPEKPWYVGTEQMGKMTEATRYGISAVQLALREASNHVIVTSTTRNAPSKLGTGGVLFSLFRKGSRFVTNVGDVGILKAGGRLKYSQVMSILLSFCFLFFS